MYRPDKKPPNDSLLYYQIKIQGNLPDKWSDWFGGLTIDSERTPGGLDITILHGPVKDLAALRGILVKLLDLNLVLISVRQIVPALGDRYQRGS